jgi:hypothetical protein
MCLDLQEGIRIFQDIVSVTARPPMTMHRYLLSAAALLLLAAATRTSAQTASLELVPFFADPTHVEIKAVMTPSNTLMNVEAVSVAVSYDPAQFYVDSATCITQKYFTTYSWDEASVPNYDVDGIAPDISIYGQYHPSFGSAPILRGNPPTLCKFTFLSKQSGGTASFAVYGNTGVAALTYFFIYQDATTQIYTPVTDISNWAYPVELSAFTATQQGQAVALRWVTVSETNNYGFFVERRAVTGEQDFRTVTFVKGAGTSFRPSQYLVFDSDLPDEGEFEYRLKQQDFDGKTSYSPVLRVLYRRTPMDYALAQNYPNPVSLSTGQPTVLSYDIAERSTVRLVVSDLLGREVATLASGQHESGRFSARWVPSGIATGMYVATLTAEPTAGGRAFSKNIRMSVIR